MGGTFRVKEHGIITGTDWVGDELVAEPVRFEEDECK